MKVLKNGEFFNNKYTGADAPGKGLKSIHHWLEINKLIFIEFIFSREQPCVGETAGKESPEKLALDQEVEGLQREISRLTEDNILLMRQVPTEILKFKFQFELSSNPIEIQFKFQFKFQFKVELNFNFEWSKIPKIKWGIRICWSDSSWRKGICSKIQLFLFRYIQNESLQQSSANCRCCVVNPQSPDAPISVMKRKASPWCQQAPMNHSSTLF